MSDFIVSNAYFCAQSASVWQFLGTILLYFKIIIPILLIIWGCIDLGRAVVGSKDDDIKKAVLSLTKRALIGVLIFFIPTLIGIIFSLVSAFNDDPEVKNDNDICKTCMVSPSKCDTSGVVE